MPVHTWRRAAVPNLRMWQTPSSSPRTFNLGAETTEMSISSTSKTTNLSRHGASSMTSSSRSSSPHVKSASTPVPTVDSQFWQFRGRPVCPVVIRVGFVLFWKFLYKPTWRGVRLPRPINIKAKADWGYSQSNQYKKSHYFYLSNPSLFQP